MIKPLEIATEGQRENLIHLLLDSVSFERRSGRKLLDGTESAARLPAHTLQTISRNLEMRTAVASKLAADLKGKPTPITFEGYFYQFLDSFAGVLSTPDPTNLEYKKIIDAIVTTPTVPSSVIERMGIDPNKHRGTMFPVKAADLTPEKVEALEMRHMGVQNTIGLVSTAFYKAAAKQPRIKQNDPSYIAYTRKLESFFGGTGQTR